MNTLFYDTQLAVDSLKYVYSLAASKEFIHCADQQLTQLFLKQTGLKPGKNVCISISEHSLGAPIYTNYLIEGTNICGRKLLIKIYINHNWNPITIYWKSKTGRDYKLHDTNIDCNDIEFWFEKLETELYYKQLYPNDKFPFKLDNLTYELVLTRLNLDCTIILTVKKDAISNIPSLINQIDEFIKHFNEKSEAKERRDGVIHNSKYSVENEHEIIYEIDLGSVGYSFFKKLLKHLSKINSFTKIEIQ